MKSFLRSIIIFPFLALAVLGCSIFHIRNSLKVSSADSINFLDESIKKNIFYKGIILNNVAVKLDIKGDKKDFNCAIKVIKDSLLTISVKSLLNLEIIRIYLNGDSIFVIDKANHSFGVYSFSSIIGKYCDYLNLGIIENLLLGNIINVADISDFKLLFKGERFTKYGMIKNLKVGDQNIDWKVDYIIDCERRKPAECSLGFNGNSIHLLYNNYKDYNGGIYPGNIEVEIKKGIELYVFSFEIGSLKVLNSSFYNIIIPDGYKRNL